MADGAIEPEKVESSSTLKELRPKVIKKGTDGLPPPPPPPLDGPGPLEKF